MPTYEFQCEKCRKRFEIGYTITEYERQAKKKIKCPKCGSILWRRDLLFSGLNRR